MRTFAYSILLICLVGCIVSCDNDRDSNPAEPEETVYEFSWLRTSGNKIVDEAGNVVVLRGVNRSGLEYDKSGNGMSQNEFAYMCGNWNARIIRIPINQEWVMTDDTYLSMLDNVIEWIKMNNAYVLLDLHWQDETVKIPPIPNEQAIDMWKKLATRYKDDPAVLYDIQNETHDVAFSDWRNRAIQIIEGIQSVHPKALMLVSGMKWASDISDWAANPLSHSNVVYSVHCYTWNNDPADWGAQFGNYADQLPIFVGEFGGYGEDLGWGKQLMAYLNRRGIGWTAWSWVDDPHLTQQNRFTPTEFGVIVREMLERYANPDQFQDMISHLKVEYITSTRATVNWKTKNRSDSAVLFGTSTAYSDTVYAPALLSAHTIKLADLQPATLYHFRVISEDEFGFVVESGDTTFTTLATD